MPLDESVAQRCSTCSPREAWHDDHRDDADRLTDELRARCPHLQALESEAIHILREVAGQFDKPVILFSAGKDSVLVLHLARKAF